MKKVLITTLQGDNIGNRLQNYALQRTIEDLGCEAYTAVNTIHEFELLRSKVKFFVLSTLGRLGVNKYKNYYYRLLRINKYNKFNDRYIHNMVPVEYSNAFKQNWDSYDYGITGSDQVWHHWSVNDDELRYFYLEFMDSKKRISYAPSFGFDKFPERDLNIHNEGIKGIKYLSCRESTGVDLVKSLTGRDAQLVLDPTLLLKKEDWIEIEKKPEWMTNGKFIVNYFLGNSQSYKDEINKFAKEKDLQVINVYDPQSLNSQLITPDEFIWLVHNSEFVCTDSFHATVFSLIFNKKFLSFRRCEKGMDKMFDRIENVQNIFGVNRVFDNDISSIERDYQVKSLNEIKCSSIKFLKNALNLND